MIHDGGSRRGTLPIEKLKGLNILIVSPNSWGTMRLSKHHYAETLARRGNRVFFLNPPDAAAKTHWHLQPIPEVPGLSIITYRPFVPFVLRFRSRTLFNIVAAAHVRWILRRLDLHLDLVWCFDVNLYSDLRVFNARFNIFHPVDQIGLKYQREVASSADLVLSVSEEILQHVRAYGVPSRVIGHGLSTQFTSAARERLADLGYEQKKPVRVGYVGNLFMPYIDRATIRILIAQNPETVFHFWGPRAPDDSNVDASRSAEATDFVKFLNASANVQLHGVQHPDAIAGSLREMDLLLMCYSVLDDPNRGCNSHKILEYLSTGRTVVSNFVSDYAGRPDLIQMVSTRYNEALPGLFKEVVRNLNDLNSYERKKARIEYALDNSYERQLDRIKSIVGEIAGESAERSLF